MFNQKSESGYIIKSLKKYKIWNITSHLTLTAGTAPLQVNSTLYIENLGVSLQIQKKTSLEIKKKYKQLHIHHRFGGIYS